MSEKSEYLRDTLSLVLGDLPEDVLDRTFNEVDALVENGKGREEEAIEELQDPAYLAERHVHPLVAAMVQAIFKDRLEINKARQDCVFVIRKVVNDYGFEWYRTSVFNPETVVLPCEEEDAATAIQEVFEFDKMDDVLAFIEQLRVDHPKVAKTLDSEVKDFYLEFEYLWEPNWYCKQSA